MGTLIAKRTQFVPALEGRITLFIATESAGGGAWAEYYALVDEGAWHSELMLHANETTAASTFWPVTEERLADFALRRATHAINKAVAEQRPDASQSPLIFEDIEPAEAMANLRMLGTWKDYLWGIRHADGFGGKPPSRSKELKELIRDSDSISRINTGPIAITDF